MATIARLTLDNQQMTVLEHDLSLHQNVDNQARISSVVHGGMIHLVVESSQDNRSIYDWASSNDMVKDGEIVFKRSETANPMRKIVFKNAHCVRYRERYVALDEDMMTIVFSIAAEEIISDGTSFKNRWK